MLKNRLHALFSFAILSSLFSTAIAIPATDEHVVVAPSCLVKTLSGNYQTLATHQSLNLIQVNDDGIDELIQAKHQFRAIGCGGFRDVTESWNTFNTKKIATEKRANTFLTNYTKPAKHLLATKQASYSIRHEKEVNQLLQQLNPESMRANLTGLTSLFHDRFAKSDEGVHAAEWIKSQVENLVKMNARSDVMVYTIETGKSYKQPSVVAKIGNGTGPGIVVGAHMDTESGRKGPKPGADDDGSGTVTVLELARVLLESGMQFKKPIYLIWYAAEEPGLVGSGFVVRDFKKKNIPVDAVIQFDMTGYSKDKNDRTMWLLDDYVDTKLTSYLETLIKKYVNVPVNHTACGYDCSDHASWYDEGFAASSPFEAKTGDDNPTIHTSNDTIDLIVWPHMTDFAKLAIAYTVELAEPIV